MVLELIPKHSFVLKSFVLLRKKTYLVLTAKVRKSTFMAFSENRYLHF